MIVIFGGSFNPPTIAHYQIAKHILTQLDCDKFFFLPVHDEYPKKGLISSQHRLAMLELVCQKLSKTFVSSVEVESNKVLTTFETLTILKAQFPNQELAFVIGADNLVDLPNWVQFEELIRNYKLIVFRREDISVDDIINKKFQAFKDQFIVLDSLEQMDISSTQYRENLERVDLVLPSIDQYVKQYQLYGRGE
ncbi:MAG: nicotinate (nicotinamide) nucleotide adenylyltransferase [Turicibacter sp.]|nr:nicotinate (nicotinamide) nucleotide adenylyltransferase [Turicibacter sp.]